MRTDTLSRLAAAHGILPGFRNLSGAEILTGPDTQRALLRANGISVDSNAMIAEALAIYHAEAAAQVHPGEMIVACNAAAQLGIAEGWDWHLVPEGQTGIAAEGRSAGQITLPPLPAGVHNLTVTHSAQTEEIALFAAPVSVPQITDIAGQPRLWGLNAALYALHSARSAGIGDFDDLARTAEAIGPYGAGFLGINPVHNLGWADHTTISPYSPSHRGYLNSGHIALDQVPGLTAPQMARHPAHAAMLDYSSHGQQHRAALTATYARFLAMATPEAKATFATFRDTQGDALARFALYEALSERHGPDWHRWPADLHSPDSPATRAAAADLSDRIAFHMWLQWLADHQMAAAHTRAKAAGLPLGLYLDLAVGARRGAAETWCESGAVAQGVSLGAPPDHLSPAGQNWNLTAYSPRKLAAQRYGPLRQILRKVMRHAGILRIDHILGMNRSYWIPDDGSPGGYIRQPFAPLLAILAIEAQRAGTVMVGEDLGLVPDGFREAINARGILSYSVLQYEKDRHGKFRSASSLRLQSLACFATHDTPTMHGFLTGRDIDWWQRLGWVDKTEATKAHKRRASETTDLGGKTAQSFPAFRAHMHRALARAPAALVTVQLDDILGTIEAQNLPGTVDEHPNWRRRYEQSIEQLGQLDALTQTGQIMTESGRSPSETKDIS